jgi:hypothetical protein
VQARVLQNVQQKGKHEFKLIIFVHIWYHFGFLLREAIVFERSRFQILPAEELPNTIFGVAFS